MSLELIALAIVGGPILLVGVLSAALTRARGPRGRACTIRELPEVHCGRVLGMVRVHRETLVAPYSGVACVLYRHGKQDRIRTRYGVYWTDTEWLPGEVYAVDCLLEDTSGTAIVELREAELDMEKALDVDATRARELVARHGIGHTVRRDATRLVEQVVVPGQRLEVVGSAVEEADPDALSHDSLRIPPPARVRIVGTPPWKLVAIDRGQ